MMRLLTGLKIHTHRHAHINTHAHTHNHTVQTTPEDVPVYTSIPSYDVLKKALDDKLREYNESNAVMNLVLFQQVSIVAKDVDGKANTQLTYLQAVEHITCGSLCI